MHWFIGLAGTIGSLLVGISVWAYLRNSPSDTLSYFGLRSFREQIILSLIYYPVFTAVSQIGDWRIIYDFSQTPFWSGVTAVFHALILIGYVVMERRGGFDQLAFNSLAEKESIEQLQTSLKNNPDPKLQLQEIAIYRERGLRREATKKLNAFLKQYPNNGDAFFEQALLQINTQETAVPPIAFQSIQKAVDLGISSKNRKLFAYRIIGQYHFDQGDLQTAVEQYNLGLKLIDLSQPFDTFSSQDQSTIASLLEARSIAYKEQSQSDKALMDISQALEFANLLNNKGLIQRFEETRARILQE